MCLESKECRGNAWEIVATNNSPNYVFKKIKGQTTENKQTNQKECNLDHHTLTVKNQSAMKGDAGCWWKPSYTKEGYRRLWGEVFTEHMTIRLIFQC